PRVGVELPDPGVGLAPAVLDHVGRGLRRPPAFALETVVTAGGREQQQRLAERIELELVIHRVADDVLRARIAGKLELPLVRDAAARGGVRGLQLRTVL